MKKTQILAPIISNEPVCNDIYLMTCASALLAKQSKPGQFVHVHCGYNQHILLRRPLSIHAVGMQKGTFSLLYRVAGKGTAALAQRHAGEMLDLIGPIGNAFPLAKTVKNPLLIGGGLGVAPLKYLAQHLTDCGYTPTIVLGFANAEQARMGELFQPWSDTLHICTMDGSKGYRGTSCARAEQLLTEALFDVVYACGPEAMLNHLPPIEGETFVSLERHMACGVGACLGCAVEMAAGGYKHVCKEGPIFKKEEVILHG